MIGRYHRRDFGHVDMDLTINDPKFYTRPFTVKLPFHLIPGSDVLQAVCAEKERDRIHVSWMTAHLEAISTTPWEGSKERLIGKGGTTLPQGRGRVPIRDSSAR